MHVRCLRITHPAADVPVPAYDGVRVGGVGIGYAKQGLGEAHEDDALTRSQIVLPQERIEAALAGAVASYRLDQLHRELTHLRAGRGVEPRQLQELAHRFALIREVAPVHRAADCGFERGSRRAYESGRGRRRRQQALGVEVAVAYPG